LRREANISSVSEWLTVPKIFPALEMPGEFVRDLREGLAAVLAVLRR
jgi:hypothetical protein